METGHRRLGVVAPVPDAACSARSRWSRCCSPRSGSPASSAYSVVQRTQEIGVRMALGAEPRHVLQLVVGHSLSWTIAGVIAGVAASIGLLRMLQGLVFGVTPTDPVVLGTVSLLLVIVSLAASYVPARRAASVNPVTALRGD